MDKIKSVKVTMSSLHKIIIYELEVNSRKETTVKSINKRVEKNEKILNAVEFAEKIYEFKKLNKLNDIYINNAIIDGTTIEIEIIYQNEETKKIICKNKFPEEIVYIRELINL